jgi:hypothetical protein
MSTKELLLAEIEKLDEPKLRAVYEFAQSVAAKNGTAERKEKNFLAALREIQIDDLPPDFSENFELYASGEKSYE